MRWMTNPLQVEAPSLRTLSSGSLKGSPKGTSVGSGGEGSFSQRHDASVRSVTLLIPGGNSMPPPSISTFSPKGSKGSSTKGPSTKGSTKGPSTKGSTKGASSVKKRDGDDDSSVDSRSSANSALSQRSFGSLTASVVSGNSKSNAAEVAKRQGHGQRRRSKSISQKKSTRSLGSGSKVSSHKSPTPYRPKTQKERLEKRDEFDIPGQMYFVEADVDEYDFIDWTKEVPHNYLDPHLPHLDIDPSHNYPTIVSTPLIYRPLSHLSRPNIYPPPYLFCHKGL